MNFSFCLSDPSAWGGSSEGTTETGHGLLSKSETLSATSWHLLHTKFAFTKVCVPLLHLEKRNRSCFRCTSLHSLHIHPQAIGSWKTTFSPDITGESIPRCRGNMWHCMLYYLYWDRSAHFNFTHMWNMIWFGIPATATRRRCANRRLDFVGGA